MSIASSTDPRRPVAPEAHTHHHGHGFDGGHGHQHAAGLGLRRAFVLSLLILVVELAGGLASHSLALLSDAGHVLTDIAALGLSWFALHRARKPSTGARTFGFSRVGVLA